VLSAWQNSGERILRIEGFTCAGKTRLANELQKLRALVTVATDRFATKSERGLDKPYLDSIDLSSLREATARLLRSRTSWVVFEGVCLEDALPSDNFG
jgi:hypothetical protein